MPNNEDDVPEFEKQMRRKVHYVIQPQHLWSSIANMARTQTASCCTRLQAGFKYIENRVLREHLPGPVLGDQPGSPKLGKTYTERNAKLCTIIQKIAEGWRVLHRHGRAGRCL
jgi:type I restriction enzyme M protein